MQNLLIPLDFSGETPLYSQIARHIAGEIQAARLKTGERLPSKRALTAGLGVSQSTVETAYGILTAEGYIEGRPRQGYFVLDILPMSLAAPPPTPERPAPESKAPTPTGPDFSTGAVDTSRFPYATWAKITKETVYQCPELLQRGDAQGEPGLRETLSRFLYQARGVRCGPEQIIIGAGMEYLLDLLLSLLPRGAVIGLEDPGYPAAWHTVAGRGLAAVAIPVGAEGMDVAALNLSAADVAYVTPSHQFPMGVTMPAGQRSRLLAWAEGGERYIIEDDYDSEFRYASRPIPALQGMDKSGKVVYLGTFSRGLAPSIRVAYLVLPPALLARYRARRDFSASTVSRLEQETLRRFVEGGHYARHLRRMGHFYREKQRALTARLLDIPGVLVAGDGAGLHFLVTKPGLSEAALLARAEAAGVHLRGLSRYAHALPCPPSTLVLGFAGLQPGEIDDAAARLRQAWAE
jgi:GntR family transcriptional regulator/MocR family aminotransferase